MKYAEICNLGGVSDDGLVATSFNSAPDPALRNILSLVKYKKTPPN
jgi:hypothetical protein